MILNDVDYEICGSHSGKDVDLCRLGSNAVWTYCLQFRAEVSGFELLRVRI